MSKFFYAMPDPVLYESIEPADSGAPKWGKIAALHPAPLRDTFPKYVLTLSKKQGQTPDFFSCASFRVISDRCKSVFGRFSMNVEFLPVDVVDIAGRPANGVRSCNHADNGGRPRFDNDSDA